MKKLLNKEIKTKAELFRSVNGLGTTDPVNLESFLLKKSITTLFKPLSEHFAGMAIKASDVSCFILVNSSHVKGKQNFTIAHEIYHLYVQEDFVSQRCVTGLFDKQKDIEEKKADIFAASFLMPEAGVMELIPDKEKGFINSVSTETLFKIQHYYQVSFNALIYRLIDIGLINKTYYDRYASGKINTAIRLGYNTSLYEPANDGRIIGKYAEKAKLLYDNQLIPETEYFRLLNAVEIDPLQNIDDQDD
jgi:Zn-dependent peptidase ImmA (M78 family)